MPKARIQITGDIAGAVMNSTWERESDGGILHQITLPEPFAGTLTTRTSDTDGEVTAAGHTISTGDTVDLYWDGGRRYDVTVGTVVGDVIPISGGAGDNLPLQDTAVTIVEQTVVETTFDGDDVAAIGAACKERGHLSLHDSVGLELSIDLVAREGWEWHNGGTAANPIAGDTITSIRVSKATITTTPTTLDIGVLFDSTP